MMLLKLDNPMIVLFATLVLSLLFYYIFPVKYRYIVLLIASLSFYLLMNSYLIAFIVFTIITVYFGARWIQKNNDKAQADKDNKEYRNKIAKYNKAIITSVVVINLLIIGALKYFGFLGSIVNGVLGWFSTELNWPIIALALPMGISYYTLQAIGYMVDVHRKRIQADKNFVRVALFLCFFPALQEGPICRYEQTANMLYNGARFDYRMFTFGAQRILWGLFKKAVIADRLGMLVSTISSNPYEYSGYASLLFIIFYTIQLYADFSGFIDISLGSAQMFGFNLPENFRQPFFATSAQDFWKRWHITLGVWLKEYVFYSVALSPKVVKFCGKIKKRWKNYFTKMLPTILALLAVWMCNGLWHGPEWKYIFYGLYYFVLISVSMLCEPYVKKLYEKWNIDSNNKWLIAMRHVRTILIIFIGETMFGANTLEDSWHILISVFTPYHGNVFELGIDYKEMIIAILSMAVLVVVDVLNEKKGDVRVSIAEKAVPIRWTIYIALLLSVLVFGAYGAGLYANSPFIYGGF